MKVDWKLKLLIHKGTMITCPKCGEEVAKASDNIFAGDLITYRSLSGIFRGMGCKLICPFDDKPFFVDGKLHTKEGWK